MLQFHVNLFGLGPGGKEMAGKATAGKGAAGKGTAGDGTAGEGAVEKETAGKGTIAEGFSRAGIRTRSGCRVDRSRARDDAGSPRSGLVLKIEDAEI